MLAFVTKPATTPADPASASPSSQLGGGSGGGGKLLAITEGLGGGSYTDEGRVITMEYEEFYLVLTYVINSGQKLERLDERIARPDTLC